MPNLTGLLQFATALVALMGAAFGAVKVSKSGSGITGGLPQSLRPLVIAVTMLGIGLVPFVFFYVATSLSRATAGSSPSATEDRPRIAAVKEIDSVLSSVNPSSAALFVAMRAAVQAGEPRRNELVGRLVDRAIDLGEMPLAVAAVRSMEDGPQHDDAVENVVDELIRERDYLGASNMLSQISDPRLSDLAERIVDSAMAVGFRPARNRAQRK